MTTARKGTSIRFRVSNPLKKLMVLAIGGPLLLFHVQLASERLGDLSSVGPAVAVRWLCALAIVAACIAIHRRCGNLLRGRRGIALWLLVALLHVDVGAPLHGTENLPPVTEPVTTALLLTPVVFIATKLLRRTLVDARRHGLKLARSFGWETGLLDILQLQLAVVLSAYSARPPPR